MATSSARKKDNAMKPKKNMLLRLLIVGFAVYMCVMIVQLRIEIDQSDSRLSEYKDAVAAQELENEELKYLLSEADDDVYIEEMARKQLKFVYPDEMVFIDISGH